MPGTVLPLASARAASSAPQRVIVSPPRFRASAKIGTVARRRVAFRRGLKNAGGEKQGLKKEEDSSSDAFRAGDARCSPFYFHALTSAKIMATDGHLRPLREEMARNREVACETSPR